MKDRWGGDETHQSYNGQGLARDRLEKAMTKSEFPIDRATKYRHYDR